MDRNSLAVSVIIPMFNAEKYLPVCLESLLIQTLTNFEVIVVDDASTDQSATIAESYLERFGGRLKIVTLPTNTGSGAVPRNVGLDFARGKYVFFADADDFLIENALEEFFNAAETFQTDIVYTDCSFICDEKLVPTNLEVGSWGTDDEVEVPTLESEDLAKRVEKFLTHSYWETPWLKFLRREFLVDNDIKFPAMRISEDIPWMFKIVCLAKNFLRISVPLYGYRLSGNSMFHRKRSFEDEVIFWTSPFLKGIDCLDEFMSQVDFFKQNPANRFLVLHFFATLHFNRMTEAFKNLGATASYEIFLREFAKAGNPNAALISYLIVMNNLYRNELTK